MKPLLWVGTAICGVLVALLSCPGALVAQSDYTAFEEGQVRPIALSADRTRLFALNSPDDRLEIFDVGPEGLVRRGSVRVGMRPVALAVRNSSEIWVVNHLSDSVSIVDVTPGSAHVARTLWVGDEPRDIVFAGPNRSRAFITTAHRGQNSIVNPQLTTPGVGRADVWVFDANNVGTTVAAGTPLAVVTLFSDTPRALAVSPDGSRVYAAAFYSGNRTTVLEEGVSTTPPETNAAGAPQPHNPVIAKFGGGRWFEAARGTDVTHLVNFSLPDFDVFTIDAMANPPREITPGGRFAGVGTTLFNMAVNPQSGALYVTNTDANNFTRFESEVRGDIAASRITVIKDGLVTPVHLNKHINYATCCAPVGNPEAQASLAFPHDLTVSSDGSTMYVTAFGSGKIGVFATAELESNTFTPSASSHITVGGGPSGVVLDETLNRLYVLTRFDNSVAVVDLATRTKIASVALPSPEPAKIVEGRPFLYDALGTSSHGDSACVSCHVDGDMDHLAWDLGDPLAPAPEMPGTSSGLVGVNPLGNGTVAFAFSLPKCSLVSSTLCAPDSQFRFNSHKGPMTTQTLRGMDNHGSMHWRGDRGTGTASTPGAQPNTGMFNETQSFLAFNPAFVNLLGRDAQLPAADMAKFAAFILDVTMPPNPIRSLNNSLTTQQQQGSTIYFGTGGFGTRRSDTVRACNGCHVLDLTANAQSGVAHPGFFGTDGRFSFENESQFFKVPQLRNMYQKVGMFGQSADRSKIFAQNPRMPFKLVNFMGDQVRGFGFNHEGGIDSIFTFFQQIVFNDLGVLQSNLGLSSTRNTGGFRPYVPPGTYPTNASQLPPEFRFLTQTNSSFFQSQTGDNERRAVEAFVMAFPSNMAPIVGQQVTLRTDSGSAVTTRLTLLKQRAAVTSPVRECDLVGSGWNGALEVGYLYVPSTGRYRSSLSNTATLTATTVENSARTAGREITFTCVPPGTGVREALDRDRDGSFDGVEISAGTDPANPASHP